MAARAPQATGENPLSVKDVRCSSNVAAEKARMPRGIRSPALASFRPFAAPAAS
jgi:hypothetical protein